MSRILLIPALVALFVLSSCAIQRVETSKALYQHARVAQEEGKDVEAIVYWKALLKQTDREIQAGHYPTTNYFLRASAHFELGEWDRGFADLKQLQPESLSKEEFWIYPLYAVLMGDYYSQKNMTSVAQNFYKTVLKKSSYKSSPIYVLALERHVNNSIKALEHKAQQRQDGEKFKQKGYEDLADEIKKQVEDFPFQSVPHFLLADLLLKIGHPEESLEQFMASLEMGLPTTDLQKSAEFEIATLLSSYEISPSLKSVLLGKAAQWWTAEDSGSIFHAGENTLDWIWQQQGTSASEAASQSGGETRVRYLAVRSAEKWKILVWEKL